MLDSRLSLYKRFYQEPNRAITSEQAKEPLSTFISKSVYSFTDDHYLAIYKRYLFPSKAVHSVSLVKVKAGSDTMIHTPQLKDSLHLN